MRTLILAATLVITLTGIASSSRAYTCETSCSHGQYDHGSGESQCHTRCN